MHDKPQTIDIEREATIKNLNITTDTFRLS